MSHRVPVEPTGGRGGADGGAKVPATVPTGDDGLLRRLTGAAGGPAGAHTVPGRTGGTFFTPMRVLILLTTLSAVVAVLQKSPCRLNGWSAPGAYFAGCYSDWAALYTGRGFAENPLAPFAEGATFEYPVLMSVVASAAALITRVLPFSELDPTLAYWDVNFVLTAALWIITVVVTAKSSGRRLWDAAMVAVAPGIILAGSINWDLWAVALLAVGMWLFGGRKPFWAGVVIGLGTAMKLYPLLLLGAVLILAVRTLRFRPFWLSLAGTAVGWSAVNLPMMIGNFPAWSMFFTFSSERGPGYSSIWHAWDVTMEQLGGPTVPAERLSLLAYGAFFLACCAIFVLGVCCRHRPRLAQLTFLIVAAFVLCNKVYSPQFVVWLIPLAALAVPNWRDFLIWQFVEVLHFWAIWMYLADIVAEPMPQHSLDDSIYVLAVLAHMVATAYLMLRVVQQMLAPGQDPVRASLPGGQIWRIPATTLGQRTAAATRLQRSGYDGSEAQRLPLDDPLGGHYDGAADRLPWLDTGPPAPDPEAGPPRAEHEGAPVGPARGVRVH